jgi:hypothetical protein
MATKTAPDYPWYQEISGSDFTQGDILVECPFLSPNSSDAFMRAMESADGELSVDIGVKRATLIVMTQACDIAHNKVNSIVLCPIWPLEEFAKDPAGAQVLVTDKGKEDLRRGYFPPFHLLNQDAEFGFAFQVVDFRELYSIPTDVVGAVAGKAEKRARLLSPYREQLAQSFARYFMRVGLPIDIPKFGK